ncbi:MAG: tetratricopeptide repeat protein [Pseudomonadota bacterium]
MNSRRIVIGLICVLLSPCWLTCAQGSTWADMDALAGKLIVEKKYKEAEATAFLAVQLATSEFGRKSTNTAKSLTNLGMAYQHQGKYVEAQKAHKEALEISKKLGLHDVELIASTCLGTIYRATGKFSQAETMYQRSLAICDRTVRPDRIQLVLPLSNLADLYTQQGKMAKAEPLLRRILALREKNLQPRDPLIGESCALLGFVLAQQNKLSEAASSLKRGTKILEEANSPNLCNALLFSATLYSQQGKLSEAEESLKRAVVLAEKFWGPNDPRICNFLGGLARIYGRQGKKAEAKKLEARVNKIRNLSAK